MENTSRIETRLQNEIKHGQKIAAKAGEVWNWEGAAGRKRWRRRVELLSGAISRSHQVLEIGCGTGYFTKELVKTGASITAIDISPDLISRARLKVSSENVNFMIQNAYHTEFSDQTFDIVLGCSVLHHLEIEDALIEFHRLLKPNGKIVFCEPNFLNPQIAVQKTVPFIKRWAGDSPDETAFFRWQLAEKLNQAKYSNHKIEPFDFLHPALPAILVPFIEPVCETMEKIPLIREIAGSLHIQAEK